MTTEVMTAVPPAPLTREIEVELDGFARETQAFLAGKGLGDAFRAFRLQHGIYSQRQTGQYMVRVKVPHGSLTADQMDALADVADRFAPRRLGHVTTRQDVQFHWVQLADVPALMRARLRFLRWPTRSKTRKTASTVRTSSTSGTNSSRTSATRGDGPRPPPTLTRKPRCSAPSRRRTTAMAPRSWMGMRPWSCGQAEKAILNLRGSFWERG